MLLILFNIISLFQDPLKIGIYYKWVFYTFICFIKSSEGSKYDKLELYRGLDAADKFVKMIEDDCSKQTKIMSRTNKPLDLSPNKEK